MTKVFMFPMVRDKHIPFFVFVLLLSFRYFLFLQKKKHTALKCGGAGADK